MASAGRAEATGALCRQRKADDDDDAPQGLREEEEAA